MEIKNIIFDFGGVIADLSWEGAVESFREIGLSNADQILDKYHQTGFFQDMEEGHITPDEFADKLSALCGRKLTKEEIKGAWMGYFPYVDTRKLEYIEELSKEYHIHVLSNTNPYIMSWACSNSFTALGKPLTHYAENLYLSYELGYTKPDIRIFEKMIEKSNIKVEETLFIDDGPSNIKAAEEAGLLGLLVGSTEDWRDKLSNFLKSATSNI